MPTLLFQILTLTADLVLFVFVAYYLLSLRHLKKNLREKETKVDTQYHQIVDNALARERKILEDAVEKANQILTQAGYLNKTSTEALNSSFSQMTSGVERNANETSQQFMQTYEDYLKQIAIKSLNNFYAITKGMETDLQNQIGQFNQALVNNIQKETSEYKQLRLKQVEASVQQIVQKASREILNKTISLDNHHDLVIAALEKAKGEGILD